MGDKRGSTSLGRRRTAYDLGGGEKVSSERHFEKKGGGGERGGGGVRYVLESGRLGSFLSREGEGELVPRTYIKI